MDLVDAPSHLHVVLLVHGPIQGKKVNFSGVAGDHQDRQTEEESKEGS